MLYDLYHADQKASIAYQSELGLGLLYHGSIDISVSINNHSGPLFHFLL